MRWALTGLGPRRGGASRPGRSLCREEASHPGEASAGGVSVGAGPQWAGVSSGWAGVSGGWAVPACWGGSAGSAGRGGAVHLQAVQATGPSRPPRSAAGAPSCARLHLPRSGVCGGSRPGRRWCRGEVSLSGSSQRRRQRISVGSVRPLSSAPDPRCSAASGPRSHLLESSASK